jgi:V/A-type H+-transporting ATPase subunit I
MILPMAKIQIIGTKPCRDATVRILQGMGMVQIDDWSETRALVQQRLILDEEALHLRERLAYLATRVEAILATLPSGDDVASPAYDDYFGKPSDALLKLVEGELAGVEPTAQALATEQDRLREQLEALPRYDATLRKLLPIVPSLEDLENYTVTAILLERRYEDALELITRQLEELTRGRCEVLSRLVDGDTLGAVLVFPKEQTRTVSDLLGQENIAQVRLPQEVSGLSFADALADIERRLREIPRQLAEIEEQRMQLAQEYRPKLLAWQSLLQDHIARIDVCTSFGQTDYTFVIEGWIPEKHVPEVVKALESEIGSEVLAIQAPVDEEERAQAPVMFENPRLVRPFEPLVELLALPKYGALDPTPLMALFLPFFFGMILGDVGYGAILLGLMVYLRRRFAPGSTLRRLSEVLIFGAGWGIVFGFLYGEFFGTLGEAVGLHPLWFDRGHDIEALFMLTIGIGIGHVVLGLGLGLWETWRRRSMHEFVEKAATLTALMAIFFIVAVLAERLPAAFLTPAISMLVVALAILIYSMGAIGFLLAPIEVLGTIGNILSYLRIAAIGLSSVYLARVANDLVGSLGSVLVGLIVAALLHALNIALGAFSPTIQSLRLHYVEFFGKFYEGGGQPFRPFQRSSARR